MILLPVTQAGTFRSFSAERWKDLRSGSASRLMAKMPSLPTKPWTSRMVQHARGAKGCKRGIKK
jgi:hypothetical protein